MKLFAAKALALSGTVLAGCASHHPPSASPAPSRVIVTPDHSLVGTVALFNPVGRFVVLNFPAGQMPSNEQVLFIYHGGLKTGEVKITGEKRDSSVVADLTSGEAQAGDEVRDQ